MGSTVALGIPGTGSQFQLETRTVWNDRILLRHPVVYIIYFTLSATNKWAHKLQFLIAKQSDSPLPKNYGAMSAEPHEATGIGILAWTDAANWKIKVLNVLMGTLPVDGWHGSMVERFSMNLSFSGKWTVLVLTYELFSSSGWLETAAPDALRLCCAAGLK